MGMKVSLEPLEKDISFIVRPSNQPTYEQLQQENARLKDRMNKAIEYVETNTCWDLRTSKVLEILKGEQNEQN